MSANKGEAESPVTGASGAAKTVPPMQEEKLPSQVPKFRVIGR
jgi:hypothetical protein